MRLVVLASLCLSLIPACKRRSTEEAPAAPIAPPPPPAAAPEETIDALNPPPPTRDMAARVDTANGHPGGPKPAELDNAQAEAQRKIQGCLDALPATAIPGGSVRLSVKYSIQKDGHTRDVTVEGGPSPEVNACGKNALEAATFPSFDGPGINNGFTLTYGRPQAPPDLAKK